MIFGLTAIDIDIPKTTFIDDVMPSASIQHDAGVAPGDGGMSEQNVAPWLSPDDQLLLLAIQQDSSICLHITWLILLRSVAAIVVGKRDAGAVFIFNMERISLRQNMFELLCTLNMSVLVPDPVSCTANM